ncbi:MAG TPA: TonB-dependent receptor [Steroidobacteraceae bacterium]|nr:TonB-dependent receptor [Steroidobacteraceae bacterium]
MKRFLFLAAALWAVAASAHDYTVGKIFIAHPWSRPTAAGIPMGVAYLSLENRGTAEDVLLRASSPAAARVELHQTLLTEGIARMRPLEQVVLPPGRIVKIEPGAVHMMLVQLKHPLEAGTQVPLTLEFRDAGRIDVMLNIEQRDVAGLENEMTRGIGTVTVVARRASTLPTTIPTTIEGITADSIRTSINATDAADALKYFPSLNVRKRYIGDFDHAVLASRASGSGNSARSLVYADGILLSNLLGNGASFTPRWGLVTPEEIDRVDVLYGPFSAAYPGNSVGAVVDYITRMPDDLSVRASLSNFSEDYSAYGPDEDRYGGWQASLSAGDRHGGTSWWVNLSRLDSDAHPLVYANKVVTAGTLGTGGVPVTGALAGRNQNDQDWWLLGETNAIHTVQDHAKIKLAQDVGENGRVSYTFGWWSNDAERDAKTWLRDASGAPVYSGSVNIDGRVFTIAPTEIAPSRNELTHVMHGLSARTRAGAWDLEAAGSSYDYQQDQSRTPGVAQPASLEGGAGRLADFEGTGWTTLHLRARRHGGGEAAHVLEFGVQDDRHHLRSEVLNVNDWLRDEDGARLSAFGGDTRLTSLYAQDSFEFAQRWQATLGARLERWRADGGYISNATSTLRFADREDDFVSPKAALAFSLTPGWTLKASTGRAVRMPTVSELFQGSIAADAIVNNDPELAPERSWTQELSALGEFDHGDLRGTFFFEDTRDALYSQINASSGTTITSIQNVEHIRTSGVELAANLRRWDTVELSASLTWTHSRILENGNNPATVGNWQPRVPEWRANALATWRPIERLSATLGARYSGRQYNQLDNLDVHGQSYLGFSRFLVFDTRVRYEIDGRWAASLGIDNLGNERYWAFHPYTRRTINAEVNFTL